MKDLTHSEIIKALSDFKPTSVIFSDTRGRISVGSENLTEPLGCCGSGPTVFFVAETFGTEPQRHRAASLREALWRLGIENDETEQEDGS